MFKSTCCTILSFLSQVSWYVIHDFLVLYTQHCTIFTILLTFWANLVMHIYSMLQFCIIVIWSQGLILNLGRSYTTFGTKIPVFRANSESLLGTKCQKWWIYKNVSKIVKIVHSAQYSRYLNLGTYVKIIS